MEIKNIKNFGRIMFQKIFSIAKSKPDFYYD